MPKTLKVSDSVIYFKFEEIEFLFHFWKCFQKFLVWFLKVLVFFNLPLQAITWRSQRVWFFQMYLPRTFSRHPSFMNSTLLMGLLSLRMQGLQVSLNFRQSGLCPLISTQPRNKMTQIILVNCIFKLVCK